MTKTQKADFRIARDGTWYHDGAPIRRAALARLFAERALKIDAQGDYWLATPFEKYPVDVEDVPFVIVDYEQRQEQGQVFLLTNMEEIVALGPDRMLELRGGVPYVEVRDGLYARIGRSVYYNMIEEFGASFESGGARQILGHEDGG